MITRFVCASANPDKVAEIAALLAGVGEIELLPRPADVPDVVDASTVEDEVEDHELSRIRTGCLNEWLAIVKERNEALAADLAKWLAVNDFGDRDLPARLAHRLEPYTPLLLTMLGDAA